MNTTKDISGQIKYLTLSSSSRNAAFLVLCDNEPVFFSTTLTQARQAILSMATEREKALREHYGHWATVSREVISDGDELRTCVQKLGVVYNGNNDIYQTLKIVKLPWLSNQSPLFCEVCAPQEEVDDEEEESETREDDGKVGVEDEVIEE